MGDRLKQRITFEAGKPLGLSIDDLLRIGRVTDTNGPAVRGARYGVVHWRITAVGDRPVSNREELLAAVQTFEPGSDMVVSLEAPAQVEGLEMPAEAAEIAKVQEALAGSTKHEADAERSRREEAEAAAAAPPLVREKRRIAALTRGGDKTMLAESELAPSFVGERRKRQRVRIADDDMLRGLFTLPSFTIGEDESTRVIAGSCTWRLTRGDARRFDVAVRACASHAVVGIRTFDCGDIYAGVEELVGRFVATARGQSRALASSIRVNTKVVPDAAAMRAAMALPKARDRAARVALLVEASVWRSANRLGVAEIDLVYLHWWAWSVGGFECAVTALRRLKLRGAIKAVGVTNVDTGRLRNLLDRGHEIACCQVNLSVVDRRAVTSGMARLCEERGVRLLVHGVLMGGLLSDSYRGVPEPDAALLPPCVASNKVLIDAFGGWAAFQGLLDTLRAVADRCEACLDAGAVTIAMVAIAWAVQIQGVSAVILGAKDATHSRDAAYAASKLVLDAEDVAAIDRAAEGRGPTGEIYGLERDPKSDLFHLAGSGAEGSFAKAASQDSSRAATTDQLLECARRLVELHACYDRMLPPLPASIVAPPAFEAGHATTCTPRSMDDWMALSAYENLSPAELKDVLRGFVCEIDCLPDVQPTDAKADVTPNRALLRTLAAKMLASAEQAIFLAAKRAYTPQQTLMNQNQATHDDMTRQTALEAQSAFRQRIVSACMEGGPTAGQASAEQGCSLS